MIFMSPGATGIKFLREPVSDGSSRVLHEEFKGYGLRAALQKSCCSLAWLEVKLDDGVSTWMLESWLAQSCSKALGFHQPEPTSTALLWLKHWLTQSVWKPFLQHPTGCSGRENQNVRDIETSSYLCSGGSDVYWKWGVRTCS